MKPCPFCGSKRLEVQCSSSCMQVWCKDCDTFGPCTKDDEAGSDQEAVVLWNRRPTLGDIDYGVGK